jgi:hypothetical protein
MATKADFEKTFMRVPAAGLAIGKTSDAVYRLMQRGELAGICQGGKWFVAHSSVEKYLARQKQSNAPDPSA